MKTKIFTRFGLLLLIMLVYIPAYSMLVDTIAPQVYWTMNCDGSVPKSYKTYVIDMPDDSNSRSNMGYIYIRPDSTFNYSFQNDFFIAGDDRKVQWWLDIQDSTQDAQAYIGFVDWSGNELRLLVRYFAYKVKIRPDLEFPKLAVGETATLTTYIVNESTTSPAFIHSFKFENHDYTISGLDLPYALGMRDSVPIQITFKGSSAGKFYDSLCVMDTCHMSAKVHFSAQSEYPKINVSSIAFGEKKIGSLTQQQFMVRNQGDATLTITRFDAPLAPDVFIPDIQDISPTNPLKILANSSLGFEVTFAPKDSKQYSDSIVFYSNTRRDVAIDSVVYLSGAAQNTTAVGDPTNTPAYFSISPNPCQSETEISFSLAIGSNTSIKIFNEQMQEVKRIVKGLLLEGDYTLKLDVASLSNGVYYCMLQTGSNSFCRKMIINR